MADSEDPADRLYGLPLEEFTTARNALARELRDSGDRDAAETVGKLPKPTRPAWAANQLARRHPKDVEALMRAGEQLRTAHEQLLSGDSGADVAGAAAQERAAVGRLVERARRLDLSDAALERVAETLHAVAGSEGLRDQLQRGAVTREQQAAMFGGMAGGPAPPRGGAKPRKKEQPPKKKQSRDDRAARERERERRREREELLKAARSELRRLRRDQGKAKRALDAADRRLGRARAQLEEREQEAGAAREREEQAGRDLAEAERHVERLEG